MTEKQNRILKLVMVGILLFSMFVVAREGAVYVSGVQVENRKEICIVIDAGHGGADPGKVGVNDQLEKDINLLVAQKLKQFLQAEGIRVVMTREGDAGLYEESASNKKVQDMKKRLEIIEAADPLLVVSIHQNSYPSPEVKGAQVFYYEQSKQGKALAEAIQSSLIAQADPENTRTAKSNSSYYLLKKTPSPTVIVECGFLSSPTEAALLLDPEYQDKLANAICEGILTYMKEERLL